LSEVRSNYNNSHYRVRRSEHRENGDIIGSSDFEIRTTFFRRPSSNLMVS
jgi:hypothetical protein